MVSLAEAREKARANRKLARDGGEPLADSQLRRLLQRTEIAAVPHGFRSSFRDWAAEETDHPREVVEAHRAESAGAFEAGSGSAARSTGPGFLSAGAPVGWMAASFPAWAGHGLSAACRTRP